MDAAIPPIRAWLEPAYDGGRTGAWMLDLPGCFVAGRDRDVALARVPSAVGGFADRFARLGEPIAVPATHDVEVVEEVPATVVDGYERNAVFAVDRRAVPADELATAVRRLGLARADLLDLLARVRAHEGAHGPLPAGEDRAASAAAGAPVGQRTSDALLRHLGGSEIWLAGRLDPGARYAGPPKDGELDAFLAASRAWALETVADIHARNAAAERTDRNGEHWTLAKVLRRLVYHALDHLGELDRRLAVATGAADALALRRDVLIDPPTLDPLLRSVGWYRLVREPGRVARLIEGSTQIVSAWEDGLLIGFARAMTDDAAYGLITTVAVHPRWQGKGLGRRLLLALLENNDDIRFSLTAVPGAEGLYASVGFVPDPRAMVRRRRR